ncbi:uncharacterized protein TA15165 [Theileria annulata]|uniref:Uncharacterized protein n=1 Tax=Theileria annulata TaxID=5874 RepID=Q4UFC8_THEAN|nr:uncharacterized protein TA15165 [Theileria annulata]CAI74188.1 hypothetical protein TA15165 [Theileria annulata]|eukprot:XP_951920.1 hypothetical protein TA15165 [Theileria annulata]
MEFTAKQLLDELINKIEKTQHESNYSILSPENLLNPNLYFSKNTVQSRNLQESKSSEHYKNTDEFRNTEKSGNSEEFGNIEELHDNSVLFDFTINNKCSKHTNNSTNTISNILDRKNKINKKRILIRGYEKVVMKKNDMLSVKKDICNLLFSHFPKYLNSSFRFKVGELCYLKWYDELCLVIINYASQKLLISSDNDFDDNYDNYDQDKNTQDRRNIWLYDINEEVFLDYDNHNLYSKLNELKPINILLDNNFTYNFTHNFKDFKDKHSIRYYFIPMYYVSFPGYKRRCSKLFRFWVQEKDLIKFKSIRFLSHNKDVIKSSIVKSSIKSSVKSTAIKSIVKSPVIENTGKSSRNKDKSKTNKKKNIEITNNCSYIITRTRGDKLWNKRKILPINEYVYDVIHNLYHHDLVSGRYITNNEFFCNNGYIPWIIPKSVRKVVIRHHRLITTNKITIRQTIKYRKSIHLIIQNFKFLLLIISKLSNPYYSTIRNNTRSNNLEIEIIDQLGIISLYMINYLETLNGNIFTKFNEIYINNFYWLDILLLWIDHFFLNNCCYTLYEYNQLLYLTKLYNNNTLSQLLSNIFSHQIIN